MRPGMIGRPARRAVVGLVALATGACMVGPNYEEPVTPVADAWQSAVRLEMSTEEPVTLFVLPASDAVASGGRSIEHEALHPPAGGCLAKRASAA